MIIVYAGTLYNEVLFMHIGIRLRWPKSFTTQKQRFTCVLEHLITLLQNSFMVHIA